MNLERLTVRLGLTVTYFFQYFVRHDLTNYWRKYTTVNTNRTVSLSKFSFFKLWHLLIRSYQVPVLLICPLPLSHFLKFKVFFRYLQFKSDALHRLDVRHLLKGVRNLKITTTRNLKSLWSLSGQSCTKN